MSRRHGRQVRRFYHTYLNIYLVAYNAHSDINFLRAIYERIKALAKDSGPILVHGIDPHDALSILSPRAMRQVRAA